MYEPRMLHDSTLENPAKKTNPKHINILVDTLSTTKVGTIIDSSERFKGASTRLSE